MYSLYLLCSEKSFKNNDNTNVIVITTLQALITCKVNFKICYAPSREALPVFG
jgi:hypothetical protein